MKGKEKGQLYAKRDYAHYHFTGKEIMKYLLQAFMLCAAVDYLFYKSIWVLLLMSPLAMGYLKWQQNRLIRERRKKLNYQFKDALTSLSVAVQAGVFMAGERMWWRSFGISKASSMSVFLWKNCFWIWESGVRWKISKILRLFFTQPNVLAGT